MTKKIILDCDPGHDDAVAIMLAAASTEIQILGITCVGGNSGLSNTINNALKICTWSERTDIKVYAGANKPITEELLTADINGMTVAEKLIEQTGVIGEKLQINAFEKLEAPCVGSYIHAGNKIATIVGLSSAEEGASVVAKDVAMQADAMNPIALNENEVDAAVIEKEIEIAKDQLRAEGKPEAMLDNIAKGKIKRFFKDNTLVNQAFIKDSKQSVAAYVKTIGDVKLTGFQRGSLG